MCELIYKEDSIKILGLSGSPRKKGNSDALLEIYCQGAKENGHECQTYRIAEMNISACKGCGNCFVSGSCIQKDDMTVLYQELYSAELIVFAFPIYMGQMSAQSKLVFDRLLALCNPDFSSRLTKKPSLSLLVTAGSGPETIIRDYIVKTQDAFRFLGIESKDTFLTLNNHDLSDFMNKGSEVDTVKEMGRCL